MITNKGPPSQGCGFSSSHVWMWELDYKESWAPKNWCFELRCWRRLLRVPWTAERSDQSIVKEISPDCSLERHVETDTPILWPPDLKSWFIWKDPDAGKDWRQEKKGVTEDEMVGWHHIYGWPWICASSGSWWWTGKPDMLQSMGSQRVGHNWEI